MDKYEGFHCTEQELDNTILPVDLLSLSFDLSLHLSLHHFTQEQSRSQCVCVRASAFYTQVLMKDLLRKENKLKVKR